MLEWSIPEAEDEDWINSCIAVSGTMASDASFANIYLLRNKYSTKISINNPHFLIFCSSPVLINGDIVTH